MNQKWKAVIKRIHVYKRVLGVPYNIFISDDMLVFSYLTKDALKETDRRLNEKVKGKSFTERMEIITNHTYELPDKYYAMDLDEILNEHPKNYQLQNHDIHLIRVSYPKTKDTENRRHAFFKVSTSSGNFDIKPVTTEDINIFREIFKGRMKF